MAPLVAGDVLSPHAPAVTCGFHKKWQWQLCSFLVQIVRALEGDMSLEDLNEGVRAGQSMLFGTAESSGFRKEAPAGSYMSDVNRARQVAMAGPVYSGAIGEYGRPSPIGSDGPFSDEPRQF